MSQPGWYSDPHGAGQRWWDGTNWTQHTQAAPAPPQPAAHGGALPVSRPPRQPQPPPAQGLVLDIVVAGRHVHADPQVIACNGDSLALDQVEWVRYHVVRTSMRGPFGFGRAHISDEWHFEVGRYPLKGAPMVAMAFASFRKNSEHEAWSFLVNLSRRYLEPRLVSELAGRVRGGETVDVGAGLKVHQGGINGGKVSLPWPAVGGTSLSGGRIWIHQTGVAKPVLFVPRQNPNAVLIPELFSTLKS
jgi:hypothetical protein